MSDPLTKGLVREEIERSSKGMGLRLRTSHHDVISNRLEIPEARFKEKNKVVADGSTLSINSIHSHDEDNVQEKVKTLRLVNEVIKLKFF